MFHALGRKSGRRKRFTCAGDSDEDHRDTIRRVKFWCSQAKNCTLQREHLCFHPSLDEVPDEAIVEALIIESGPDEKPLPDDQSDAHVAALATARVPEEVEHIIADPE